MSAAYSGTHKDYLKTIYLLTVDGGRAETGQIAEKLRVTPASVTDMIQRLASESPPLVDYQKYHGVTLTSEGEQVALQVLRHYRLLELFLHEILGYSWDKVHTEANRLEHAISEYFGERVAEVLGEPTRGLYGSPIPSKDLEMPHQNLVCLHDLRPGESGIMHSIWDEDPGLFRYLEKYGLKPGVKLSVLDYSPYDHNLHLQVEGQEKEVVLGASVTAQIFVEKE
ncbi:MAG: Iron-dependent repressor IdeR [Chloroflexi bacterium]|nr:Iron-dependent repressor IdeR [Chloroflexota bacterium]